MILVITPEYAADQELDTVVRLLDEGLDGLHIRKYQWTAKETATYVRSIPEVYHPKLVLHAQHELIQEFDIRQIHYSERDRLQLQKIPQQEGVQFSSSVHDIHTFNELEETWRYAFLSPFFPSISKPDYGLASTISSQLAERNNNAVKLIALGGIDVTNIEYTLSTKVDGVALLGAIWESNDPMKAFRDCRDAVANTNIVR
ncbi:thiamine phosphate synthase [Sphingobacterium sp. lm-10]|uniref:thiamine phosphate synthase n=1 Tax=Sphingobacterium sp. lm-10 TaxID=2944904 RepID=UPI0020221732|nr:thiamine phosphate synthase [Sphingobacterium sp. lm-10]MCL7987459.1 thiamine phosphate synthase [Sphingobacterium sp. lm-10]